MNAKLTEYLDRVDDLPAIPAITASVQRIVDNPSATVDDMREVIEQDAAIAARLLRVANSSLYSFTREIETLSHAITMLGFRTVRNVVLAATLKQTFKRFGLAEKLLWEHSTVAAAVAMRLADHPAVGVDREEAFIVGLLHDIGKCALNNATPEEYSDVTARVYNEGIRFVDAEREAFGFDHAEMGASVAAKWKLSPGLEEVIRYHHNIEALPQLDESIARMTALASVATACCTRMGVGRREPIVDLDLNGMLSWQFLGLSAMDVAPILEIAAEQRKEALALLG